MSNDTDKWEPTKSTAVPSRRMDYEQISNLNKLITQIKHEMYGEWHVMTDRATLTTQHCDKVDEKTHKYTIKCIVYYLLNKL